LLSTGGDSEGSVGLAPGGTAHHPSEPFVPKTAGWGGGPNAHRRAPGNAQLYGAGAGHGAGRQRRPCR
jgi:hypothetical protein